MNKTELVEIVFENPNLEEVAKWIVDSSSHGKAVQNFRFAIEGSYPSAIDWSSEKDVSDAMHIAKNGGLFIILDRLSLNGDIARNASIHIIQYDSEFDVSIVLPESDFFGLGDILYLKSLFGELATSLKSTRVICGYDALDKEDILFELNEP